MPRLHIMGAAGSGCTTLGSALSDAAGCPHHDTDTFLWLPTDPPFLQVRPVADRIALLRRHLAETDDWVLSGALAGWGDAFIPMFDLVVYLNLPTEQRLARLRAREATRHGSRIESGGDLAAIHASFLAWAAAYDSAGPDQRSRAQHEAWLADLPCPVLRLHSADPVPALCARVLERVGPA